MKKIFYLLVFFFTLQICSAKLYQTFVFFRHGARYHTDGIYDQPTTSSQLTPIGMRMLQNLGKIFRKQYIQKNQLLNDNFNSSQFQIYSTRYHRTIQSAVSFSYGLYPAGQGTKLPEVEKLYHLPPYSTNKSDIEQQSFALPNGHQIIPVKFDDKVILKDCQNWDQLINQVITQRKLEFNEMNMTYYPFLKKLTALFFKNQSQVITLPQSIDLFDRFYAERYQGKNLPSTLTQQDYQNLKHLSTWYCTFTLSNNLSRLINTYKFNKIINQCQNRIQSPKDYPRKVSAFSGHDTDIGSLYSNLNISTSQCVQDLYRKGRTDALNCQTQVGFASNLIIELHSDDQKIFYVMIRSNGKYMNLCQKQSTKCEYIEFRNRLKQTFIPNPQDICKH